MYFQRAENSVDPLVREYPVPCQGAHTSKIYGSVLIRVLTNERLRWPMHLDLMGERTTHKHIHQSFRSS